MKAAGALLVVLGSAWIAAADTRSRRRRCELLQELSAALLEMEASVRWKRQALPEMIAEQAERPLCGHYFAAILDTLAQGVSLPGAWAQVFSTIAPKEAADCLCQVTLSGDETHLMGNFRFAAESLQRLHREMREKERQEGKLRLSLLFSGVGMLIILLL